MKKAEPYQETLSKPWNSSVILGIAVATIVLQGQHHARILIERRQHTMSRETRKMLKTNASTMKKSWTPCGYSPSAMGISARPPSMSVLLASSSFFTDSRAGESRRGVGRVLLSISFSLATAGAPGEGARVETELSTQLVGRVDAIVGFVVVVERLGYAVH